MPLTPLLPADATPCTAMLLAAGRGERMRPLTDHTPKPLLQVQGKSLLQWHLQALARDGVQSAAINTAWLGAQIETAFGAHSEGLALQYSHEGRDFGGALETAGGIARALPLLAPVFWLLAGDVFAPDFVFAEDAVARFARSDALAHIWLVPNPPHNPRGDFGLEIADAGTGLALNLPQDATQARWTYSTIGLYRREFLRRRGARSNPAILRVPRHRWRRCCVPQWTSAASAPRCIPGAGPMSEPRNGWRC